jgi:hypothetical protein
MGELEEGLASEVEVVGKESLTVVEDEASDS